MSAAEPVGAAYFAKLHEGGSSGLHDLIAQLFVVIAVKNVKVGIIVRQPFHCLIQHTVFQRKITELLVRGDVLMK